MPSWRCTSTTRPAWDPESHHRVQEGLTIIHTAVRSMANGPSMPSTEMAVDNMRRLGHEVAIDDSRLAEVSEHLAAIAVEQGHHLGEPVEYSLASVQQQFPGGMTGHVRNQLVSYGMEDRLPEVLEEAIRVRAEMGYRSWRHRSRSSSGSRRCSTSCRASAT